MKVCDLKEESIVIGLKIKSLVSDRIGTVVKIDYEDDRYAWVLWDGDLKPFSGFYGNDCRCEVVNIEAPDDFRT